MKNAENSYPSELILSRRDMYVKQAAAMAVLLKTAGNGTTTNRGNGASSSGTAIAGSASLGTLLETLLVIMIVVESGVAAYIYRDKIADFINTTFSSKVEVAANPTEDSPLTPAGIPVTGEEIETATPAVTFTATSTVTVTAAGTSVPSLIPENKENTSSGNAVIESTPPPTKDNPGNHFGNTPKPERTKDSKESPSDNKDKDKDKKN